MEKVSRVLPRLLVIAGPSGVGKGALVGKLLKKHSTRLGVSVSHTTRSPRPGEVEGSSYYFVSTDQMKEEIERGKFLENATTYGHMYGTSVAEVERISALGKACVLEIDVKGVQQVQKRSPRDAVRYVFIAPPNLQELERRLRHRKTESEDSVNVRMKVAEEELAAVEKLSFDRVIVNGDLDKAFQELDSYVTQEFHLASAASGGERVQQSQL